MMLKPLGALLSTNTATSIGLVTEDATLAFQLINTGLLLLIVIGIPVIIYKLIKNNKSNKKEIESKGRIKNLMNFKKAKIYIIAIVLLIFLVAFVGLLTKPKKDSEYYAQAFLEILTTPENAESTKYIEALFDLSSTEANVLESNMALYVEAIKKEYGPLMTDRGFENAISNRNIPMIEMIKKDKNVEFLVDAIDFIEANSYDDGRVHYVYLISLRVSFESGETEAATVTGDIVMAKESNRWKVDIIRPNNSSYQDLQNLLGW